MTRQPDDVLHAELALLRARLEAVERKEAARSRRAKALGLGALLCVATAGYAASPVCANGIPFCFQQDEPAIAAELNTNFAQLKAWLEAKVGGTGTVAAPSRDITTTGVVRAGAYFPVYQAWGATTPGGGGAGIVNDQGAYNALMLVGNNAAGGPRVVQVHDELQVAGRVLSNGYDVSCAGGESGYHFGFCCRMNVRNGATECKNGTTTTFASWNQTTTPFAAGTAGPYSLDCAGHRSSANWPICCRTDVNGATSCVHSPTGGPLAWQAATSPW